ncbi:unnamed protein product [Clonostachys rosea]|uniref:alpha-L-rhamnosidase n=1 Tax=Bionectria ochroleuca TaxID=29856 RepID=A0ABY6UMG3_BIOOC|nr:unnamed protein product [Clonostachys rosea]
MAPPSLTKPTLEHLRGDQLFSGSAEPRISWKFAYDQGTASGWEQNAYEIEVSSATGNKPELFLVESSASVLVPWPRGSLKSRESALVRVRSRGTSDKSRNDYLWTEWSETASIETVLLEKQDWSAQWIASSSKPEPNANGSLQPLRFYKTFDVPSGPVSKARIYISALGVFDVHINGQQVGDEFMAPGWTCYQHRIPYRALDITSLLEAGKQNTVCVEVAEGWYYGRLGFNGGTRFIYGGDELAVIGQIEVHYTSEDSNGSPWTMVTDDSWKATPSAIQQSEIYDGETYDARNEKQNWKLLSLDGSASLNPAKTMSPPKGGLFFAKAPPVRVTETVTPIEVFRSKSGKAIIDFGQNLVGKLLVKNISLPNGERVTFKHAEVMEHGELGTRPLRIAKATDTVVSAGQDIKDWTPRFTFHGFRYVQVDNWPGELPSKDDFVAQVLHTDLQRRGYFNCSNKSVNQLHKNVVWSMRSNFVSIPTDCPQRDERLGWTGDLQVFCPSASFLYDVTGMLSDWLQDVVSEQMEEERGGIPPLVCPDILPKNWPHMPQAIWDDVTVLTPEVLYKYSGDIQLLENHFESMQTWIDKGIDRGPDGLWNSDRWQLGDWLDPRAPPEFPGDGRTDSVLVADAYLVRVTNVISQVCSILGKNDLAAKYGEDAAAHRAAFQDKYISPKGNLMSNSQTGVALAIQHGLYKNKEQLATGTASLNKLVRSSHFHIATGFAGTPIITHALTASGATQLAYRMLLEKTCPSWMYPVSMGATTIWERWDSMLPDGTINPGEMTSFNHYALGAVADWLHGTVAGISPLEPGWKTFRVRPIPGGNLTNAEASFDGPYGLIKVNWVFEEGKLSLKLQVPPNSKAVVILPSETKDTDAPPSELIVGSGLHDFSCAFNPGEWPPLPSMPAHKKAPGTDTIAV